MNGTWKSSGGGDSGVLGAIAVLVVIALSICAVVSAVGNALAKIPVYAWICGVIALVAVIAGLVTLVVHVRRAENARMEQYTAQHAARVEAQRQQRQMAARQRQAIAPPEQHQHLHFHGMTPDAVAAILAARDR